MAEHPNATRCREIYEIIEHGTMDQVRAILAHDVVWQVPGRGKFAGPKNGIDEVFAFFEKVGWERARRRLTSSSAMSSQTTAT